MQLGHFQMGDFASPGLNYRTTTDLVNDPNDTPNTKKRPWPFATGPLSSDGPSSPSAHEYSEPLYLLGSVSCAIPVRTF